MTSVKFEGKATGSLGIRSRPPALLVSRVTHVFCTKRMKKFGLFLEEQSSLLQLMCCTFSVKFHILLRAMPPLPY